MTGILARVLEAALKRVGVIGGVDVEIGHFTSAG